MFVYFAKFRSNTGDRLLGTFGARPRVSRLVLARRYTAGPHVRTAVRGLAARATTPRGGAVCSAQPTTDVFIYGPTRAGDREPFKSRVDSWIARVKIEGYRKQRQAEARRRTRRYCKRLPVVVTVATCVNHRSLLGSLMAAALHNSEGCQAATAHTHKEGPASVGCARDAGDETHLWTLLDAMTRWRCEFLGVASGPVSGRGCACPVGTNNPGGGMRRLRPSTVQQAKLSSDRKTASNAVAQHGCS